MKTIQKTALVIAVIVIVSFSAQLQEQSPKVSKTKDSEGSIEEDIRASLESWNQAAKDRDLDRIDIDHFENTAWIFKEGFMVVTSDEGNTGSAPYHFTGILVKKDNEWKWRLFNRSVPDGE